MLDPDRLKEKQLEFAVGILEPAVSTGMESVYLKLFKKAWAGGGPDPLTAPSRIFFSIWVYDGAIREGRLYYNIHALKLRDLEGYAIKSRDFAGQFRTAFKKFAPQWPNVSLDYGPQTLMQGWDRLDTKTLPQDAAALAQRFVKIEHLIDDILHQYARPRPL